MEKQLIIFGVLFTLFVLVLSGCFFFKPSAPTNLTAKPLSTSSIQLNWYGVGKFIIFRSTKNDKDFRKIREVNSSSYKDTDLLPNTAYYYEIKTKNEFGVSEPSNVASATTYPSTPNVPILKVSEVSTNSIKLTWEESSASVVEGYELYRSNDSVKFTDIATFSKEVNTYVDLKVEAGTTYYYKLKVYNKGGDSFSGIVKATTKKIKTAPNVPEDLRATAVTSGSVTLEWSEKTKDVDGFKVYRSMSEVGTFTEIGVTESKQFTDTNLKHATTYYYEVRAYNEVGESKPSSVVEVRTCQEVPLAPSNLRITLVSTDTVGITWRDNSDNEEGFKIYRKESNTFTPIASVTKNATTYVDERLKSDTVYVYKVAAYNEKGVSMSVDLASTKTKEWIPTAPEKVEVMSYSASSITLEWEPTYEATVVIYRKSASHNTCRTFKENDGVKIRITLESSSGYTPIATLSYKTVKYTDENLQYNTTYYYKLRSYTKYGWSPFSTTASVTTKNILPKAPSKLCIKLNSPKEAVITWEDNSNNEEGFKIWRKDDPTRAYTLIASVKAGVSKYVDSNRKADKEYWYMVSAYNSVGNSWSNSATIPNGTLRWKFKTGDDVDSAPAVDADGTVYVGSEDGYLYAINSDGTLRWKYKTGGAIFDSPTIGPDGTIYVGSEDYYIYAINSDGTLRWKYGTNSDIYYSSPAIGADGTVYIGSDDGYLYAITPPSSGTSGILKWKYYTGDIDYSSPAIGADGTVYVCSKYYLYAINPDGTFKWYFEASDYLDSSPAIGADGTVYVGSENGYLYAINSDGTLRWKYETGGEIYYCSSPAIGVDGTVYIGSDDGYLYAITPPSSGTSGILKWKYETGNEIDSSPAIGVDGTVYVGSSDHYLYALNPNGTLKWKYETGNSTDYSSPAVGPYGMIYIGAIDYCLYMIKCGSRGLANSPWPMFHRNLRHTGESPY